MRRIITIMILVLLSTIVAQGQIVIGGNVYGGGNEGNVGGSTKVTVRAGDIDKVFGGARMANVGGNTFVNVDGENAIAYMIINYLFGGNDIAGTIGTAAAVGEPLPAELEGNPDGVDDSWNSYVHLSTKMAKFTAEEAAAYNTEHGLREGDPGYKTPADDKIPATVAPDNHKIFIGQVFAGGNGDYHYEQTPGPEEGKVTHSIYLKEGDASPIASIKTDEGEDGFKLPDLTKTYLDIQGGTIFFAHGGGNNATVTEKNVIHVDNPSDVVTFIKVDENGIEDENGTDLLTDTRIEDDMGIRMAQEHVESDEFQIGRLFGGNNKAEMAIRPTWNLQAGKIRNLYSGGNRGNMTSPEGLLLEIDPLSTNTHPLVVDNVYGGCRMADVMPTVNGEYVPCSNLEGYKFPNELSARVLIRGGDINNVYGGNDVTGAVYGGNAIGIYTTIRGDVYGGGNGAYAYTDIESYKDDDTYGDFYYSQEGFSHSIDALNAFRPNAEQVSIRLNGTDAAHPTIIKGSVYIGGNCASLSTLKSNPLVELKMGSHVIVDKVFLGNNGEKMVDEDILRHYAGVYPGAGSFSSLNYMKNDASLFASYMDGVTMPLHPSIVFDKIANGDPADYVPYSSFVGSFYCGGNKGSMTYSNKNSFKFDEGLVIFEKLVGGCNDADVEAKEGLCPAYSGGILGASDERESYTEGGKIKDRIELELNNVVIQPMRWNDTFEEITAADIEDGKLIAGQEYYTTNLRSSRFIANGTEDATIGAADKYYKLITKGNRLDWNTALWSNDEDDFVKTGTETVSDDKKRRLMGGNVYGGCYSSGHINGNVVININQDLIKRDVVFAEADSKDPYKIKDGGERRSGVLRESQGDDVMAVAMTVFGGGCGEETEIWGSATVNLNNGYTFQIFGGGEEGVVGKKNSAGEYVYNAAYSTTVNLKGPYAGYSEEESGSPLAEAEYLYGGGSEGDVLGDSYVYLGNGRIYDAFGGASNADIYGGTEVYIGYNGGFPWVRDNVYGGNDFGGTIRSKLNHTRVTSRTVFDAQLLQSATYVKYIQGRVDTIFGGNYGSYDYADPIFKDYTYSRGEDITTPDDMTTPLEAGDPRLDEDGNPIFSFPHLTKNSFVHFIPDDNSNNKVGYIFGGSEGFSGNKKLNNSMQTEAYVLIDDTKTKDANRFANVDIYGGGAFAGVGSSETDLGAGRTAVDLFTGSFHNVYGGCNQEGLVGYTRVNVPSASTAKVNALFGGGKGYNPELFDTKPELAARYCDHYITCVDYQSKDAIVEDAIYGGNENCRISCDTYINVTAPVMQSSGYQATVYGAGYGKETVSGRTNVFMNNGSNAYKVFGGGRDGNAFNFASLRQWLAAQFKISNPDDTDTQLEYKVTAYGDVLRSFGIYLAANPISLPDKTGTYVNDASGEYDGTYTNDILTGDYHQTNVHILNGGNVSGYAYGGGFGADGVVSGTTYLELLGGNVDKDIYGGGQGGMVYDEYGLKTFTAATNVYIEGGMARNVYGGGYLGDVGKHSGEISDSNEGDIPAVANVTIGKVDGSSFYNGVPAIQRNVYGGGEGGSVYGTANLTINNGYIGYRYKNTATSGSAVYQYVEELDDQKPNSIEKAGNAFGGGYVVNSYVDNANVTMYGGTIRGSLYGGGEVGPIGRGTIRYKDTYATGLVNGDARIFKAGKTHVEMYDGHVLRNVFGGGRGHDSWGGDGTKYMDAALIPALDLKCKGYVFGQTEVDIYGGEIGTSEGVALGYGNVFGGGDIGFVYSAYELADRTLCIGKKNGTRYDGEDNSEGYYYKFENGEFKTTSSSEYILTEDCKVVVEPWCKAKSDVSINGTSYAAGKYVPTSALHYLGNKTASAAEWTALGKTDVNKEGIIIHNAVFAGGNTSPGSTEVYANTTTVFGNATASIHDVYNRDLISIGRGRVGGLYGDGNLTLVDGYRELNITNYGTDFYHITSEITLAQYNALPVREAAYYEIRYKCLQQCTDKDGKTYAKDATITADEMVTVFDGVTVKVNGIDVPMLDSDDKPLDTYWEENGVCSRYAGRPMNTIQRADFCGVFGSRMVMQGAQDRVPEVVDYTNYTINRVREVSLNKKTSVRSEDTDPKDANHGNYFGIYSVVNFLGALTSDVDFHNVRVTDNADYQTDSKAYDDVSSKPYETATYYDWKAGYYEERKRNNGNSHNKVALASGVYLELTSEKSTGKGLYEKDWGYVTGVVELDLINVQPGIGGGYVYAKNEHGQRSLSGKDQTILTELNKNTDTGERAVTYKAFTYTTDDATKKAWETSGNFIHSTQTIIDDCYNIGDRYKGAVKDDGSGAMPAHYWYIRGAVYVYDQYISAYTGSPNAFSETVSIPLTITSASHGKMTLMNVQPNYYAYYSNGNTKTKIKDDQKIVVREKEYSLNDPITYWDYCQLTASEKNMFVRDTYVTIAECTTTVGTANYPAGTYPAGTVLLKTDYDDLRAAHVGRETLVYNVGKEKDVDFDEIFRSSNNVSHDTGYILTYNVDNPNLWNKWYTNVDSATKDQTDNGDADEDGPTYTPITTGLYGQNDYKISNIISAEDYTTYTTAYSLLTDEQKAALGPQATFVPAYVVTKEYSSSNTHYYPGAPVAEEISGYTERAYVVTSTVQLSNTEFMYRNTYLTESEIDKLKTAYPSLATEIAKAVSLAYYCTEAGKYGGNYYEQGHNYRALAAYSAMSPEDRANFTFNYDALDLLIDPTYGMPESQKYQYDGNGYETEEQAKQNKATYSIATPIDYEATYKGSVAFTYIDDNGEEQTIKTDETSVLTRTEFERLPNEQYYWAPVKVGDTSSTYYVVKETIVLGDTPYAAGQVISKDTYDGLNADDKLKVASLTFTNPGDYYYCREAYTISSGDDGHAVSSATGVTGGKDGSYTKNTEVPTGVVITDATYDLLTNKQKNFSFHGLAPTETSTLYVTRSSDIYDLSKEKIITVIYQYDYVESDMDGQNITPVSERHILNIHLNFRSGIPTVEDILPPDIILPGTSLSMPEPYVTPGAYEITGGGWKLFDTVDDAERHINGVEYTNSIDPLYLYQHGHYLAYYAKTYLGETYSNHVPVSVANYHDLKNVMDAKDHHYYIDHQEVHERLKVEPKIYINDYKTDDPETTQNGLDLFKNLYDLSLLPTTPTDPEDPLYGHNTLNERVKGCDNLEFFLRTDIDHPAGWTPIASTEPCFAGTLHGDGHTISGLDNSLFGRLCGSVYNLGVTGSFTGAGVVDEGAGYVESCWINTTGTPNGSVRAVFGNPTADSGYKQIVNSYYQEGKSYSTTDEDGHGLATAKPDRSFYNGEVAYNLNNFYLYKRYNDKKVSSGAAYRYFTIGEDNTLTLQPEKYYASNPALCSSGYAGRLKYVENRFADGDFRYAGGTIPEEADERLYIDTEDENKEKFFPIWPDDYIFFGQKLTYGWAVAEHQNVPTAVARNNGRLSQLSDANRVYRAPAYFRSKEMGSAYFNPEAYLAQKSKDGSKEAYPGMTAIDFAGHNRTNVINGTYGLGMSDGLFYSPLLDDDGLLSITNCDETKNLLVYAPAETATTDYANKATYDVLTGYFVDPAYSDYYSNPTTYRTVADATPATASIYGHLVKNELKATTDHLLVDKEYFNCPIAYTFDSSHRMWYQRKPEDNEFVDREKGWQGISIPFTAELVTTDDKGEITHFYSGSETSKNGTGTKIGHEYWLREFSTIKEVTKDETTTAYAILNAPNASGSGKTVTNTFLWDYYYKNEDVHNQKDRNDDTYQTYYNSSRTYSNYALLKNATPYILGLPGKTYYEFDLSGSFEALNTAVEIEKLGRQTITFASNTGIRIDISDDETKGVKQTYNSHDYTFMPSYMNMSFAAGTNNFTLNTEGNRFDKVPDAPAPLAEPVPDTQVYAFRPYFTGPAAVSPSRPETRTILFSEGSEETEFSHEDEKEDANDPGSLTAYAGSKKIVVESDLRRPVEVRIISPSGLTFNLFTIQPGETIETRIRLAGVYIVHTTDTKFVKKLTVK